MERSTDFGRRRRSNLRDADDSTTTPPSRKQHMYDTHRHPRHRGEHSRGGPGHGHGRHRARRGALVAAVLTLLDERPMHGYELITELEDRSEGRWRPSPGAMYPALKRMAENDLVTSDEVDGKRQFRLTDTGRARLAELRDQRGDDDTAPWDATDTGGRGVLRGNIAELIGQARQIGRFGTAEQIAQAQAVLEHAKRELYAILAKPAADGDTTDSDGDTTPETD